MKTLFTLALGLGLCGSALAQPVNGTTTFDSPVSVIATNGSSPRTGTLEGWNMTMISSGQGNIQDPAGCVVLSSALPISTWQEARFSSSTGSSFQLKSFTFQAWSPMFLTGTFIVKGYKSGSLVAGASLTSVVINLLNNSYTLDVSTMPGFFNIDEFRVTPFLANASGSMQFDDITIGASIGTLPLSWTKPVTATIVNKVPVIKWYVNNQLPTEQFIIERSSNGTNFTAIATVPATAENSYSFTDANAPAGKNYYRIRQTDAGGSNNYSNIATTDVLQQQLALTVYPNPAVNHVTVGNVPAGSTIQLLDQSGRILLQQAQRGDNSIDMTKFPMGMYVIKLKGGIGSVQFVKE